MPPGGATFDESTVPHLDKGGLQGGVVKGKLSHPGAPRLCRGGSIRRRQTRHTSHPRRGRWPRHPLLGCGGELFNGPCERKTS
jgi:hypothetical protein